MLFLQKEGMHTRRAYMQASKGKKYCHNFVVVTDKKLRTTKQVDRNTNHVVLVSV